MFKKANKEISFLLVFLKSELSEMERKSAEREFQIAEPEKENARSLKVVRSRGMHGTKRAVIKGRHYCLCLSTIDMYTTVWLVRLFHTLSYLLYSLSS